VAEFIGLYRGRTVSDAELVAICAEPRIVSKFFAELVGEQVIEGSEHTAPELTVVRDEE
jgi:hypothetical protein